MYEKYWNLNRKPFENTPDPAFFYYSKQHEEALARLIYAVRERKGAALLTGVFGCGKTLIGHALLKELSDDRYKVAYIANPFLSYLELLMFITSRLGAMNLPDKKSEVLTNVILDSLNILYNNARDGKDTIVIVDECHIIEDQNIFEELRLLLNFQLDDRFLLTLLLFGQPELKEKINSNKQLEQRIAIKCHLDNLAFEDTLKYINHRLKIAGCNAPIFSESALRLIYERSGGIPRRINRLCDTCLLSGMINDVKEITDSVVLEEAKDLGN